ncbi:related to metallo-beta-lactamase domain protein [Ramularia collo-cygni]|uniref:Related to metallo-beta-lactamase domain protein n=1 Tax=Ramularia collo-cygni TaxID=112498 RepID=A0A2D3ULT6_9PEZI|nr:related to metallo-beta-lactamase domain protein [Ramularia collo-cygni]CZT15482.1 related to metallo-beta-lactamase domain protein [Ramularia collo-cygni]
MEDDKGGYRQISKSLNVCAFEEYLAGQIANLPFIPVVEQLSPRVLRILGQNPGRFTFQGTNTYVVGTGSHRLIIDTSGGEPEWARLVEKTFLEQGITLSHVLITHWHGDHQGGAPDLVRMYPHLRDSVFKNDPEEGQRDIEDNQVFRVEGATVRAVHAPGHSHDHMCFVLEEEQAMFTGDNILGTGTSAVEDLGTFIESLKKMQTHNCTVGYSAHGTAIPNLRAKILGELTSKLRRERQIMQALSRLHGRGQIHASTSDVVAEIYGDSLDEQTRSMALVPFIDEVLQKLAGDGRVAFQMRGGAKTWYSVEALQRKRAELSLKSEKKVGVTVQVLEVSV